MAVRIDESGDNGGALRVDAASVGAGMGPQVVTDGETAGQTRLLDPATPVDWPAQHVCVEADVERLLAGYRRLFDA